MRCSAYLIARKNPRLNANFNHAQSWLFWFYFYEDSFRLHHIVSMKILVLILGLSSICVEAQQVLVYTDKKFEFRLYRDSTLSSDNANYFCPVKSIAIYNRPDPHMVQQIFPPENSPYCDIDQKELFIIEDMNFDGHADIRLFQFLPAGPNIPYYYWLFDPKQKKFALSKELEEVISPGFDSTHKIISSQWRAGWGHYGLSKYKFINDKLVLIEEKETKPDPENENKIINTYRKRVNGKIKIIKREVVKIDSLEH